MAGEAHIITVKENIHLWYFTLGHKVEIKDGKLVRKLTSIPQVKVTIAAPAYLIHARPAY